MEVIEMKQNTLLLAIASVMSLSSLAAVAADPAADRGSPRPTWIRFTPDRVVAGGEVRLEWSSPSAPFGCSIRGVPGVGGVPTSGSTILRPTTALTAHINC